MFAKAPMHIEDKRFEGLTICMNLKDELEADYYDDGVCGTLHAAIRENQMIAETSGMMIEAFEVYSEKEIRSCVIDGKAWKIEELESGFRMIPAEKEHD